PIIRSDIIVADRVTNVGAPTDVAGTLRVVLRAILGRKNLIKQSRRITAPPGIEQGLTADRELDGIEIGIEISFLKAVRGPLGSNGHSELRQILPNRGGMC